eukprot:gene4436-3170_t
MFESFTKVNPVRFAHWKSEKLSSSKHNFVVYIPLLGPTLGHGVLEIHGLVQEGSPTPIHRSGEVLRSMIASKDYSFMNKTRFWKKKTISSLAGIPQQSDSFIIVSGRVTEIMHTKNGVPYYGGPRFVITWEDGKSDEGISGQDLVAMYKETVQSLGGGTVFTGEINYHLTQIASDIGDLLESRKADIFVKELRKKLSTQQLNVVGMMELALQSVSVVLSAVKEIALLAYKHDTGETKALIQYNLDPQSKYGRQYAHSALLITQEMVDSNGDVTELIKPDSYSTVWLGAEVAVPKGFLWGKSTFYDQYFMIVHKGKPYSGAEITSYDRKCFFGVLSSIEEAIQALWMVEQTRRMYKEFVKALEAKLFEWRAQSQVEICHNALDELMQIFQADAYIGLVQRGADQLRFIAATKTSKMEGKLLKKTEGISFDVIDTLKTVLLEKKDLDKKKLLIVDAVVDVMYGKKAFKGKLVKIHGHDMYDVRYDVDNRVEAGVEIGRIIPQNKAFKMKTFGVVKLPVVIIPIRNRGKCFGVLGLDSIALPQPTGSGQDDLHNNVTISHDLQVCLEQVGRVLGAALDAKAKKFALESMYIVGKNQYAEMHDLIHALFDAVFASSCYVSGVVFAETSIHKSGHQSAVHVHAQEGDIHSEVYRKIQSFERAKFGKRAVHKLSGSKSVWIICDLPNAKSHGSTVYFAVVTFCAAIQDPDFEFMEVLQKALMTLIQSIITFRSGSEMRRDALAAIKRLCSPSSTSTGVMAVREPTREQWFQQILDSISTCFAGTNMYAGLLGKYSNEINFILASAKSVMGGRQLRRREGGMNRNVTFIAVDNEKSVCITATSPLAMSLQHFGSKQAFEFPFIVTPVSAGIDSLIGVLSADGCGGHQSSAESEDQLADVVIFFQAVANLVALKIQQYRKEDFHRMLQQLCLEKATLNDAYEELVNALLRYLPFGQRIVNLTYHPSMEYNHGNKGAVAAASPLLQSSLFTRAPVQLKEELVLLLCPISFFMHEHHHSQGGKKTSSSMMAHLRYGSGSKFTLRVSWLGETLCDVEPDDPNDDADHVDADLLDTYLATCPAKTSLDTLKLVLQLMNSDKKVVAKLTLPFHTLEHAPCHDQILRLFDTTATNIADAEAAKVCMRFKLFASQAPVGLRLNAVQIHAAYPPTFTEEMRSACQLFVVINWNGRTVGRSEYTVPSGDASEWNDIGAYLPLASYLPRNTLILEVWVEKTRGKTHVLGTATIEVPAPALSDMRLLESLVKAHKKDFRKVETMEDMADSVTAMSFAADLTPLHIRQLREEERLTALHLLEDVTLYQDARLVPLKKQRSIRKDEEYVQVELGLLCAKYLVPDPEFLRRKAPVVAEPQKASGWQASSKSLRPRFLLDSMKMGGSTAKETAAASELSPASSPTESRSLSVFVYVTLDGVEVGTSSIVAYHENGAIEWKDEFLRLSLPVGESIDNSMLRLEVYLTDESMKQSLLGWIELQGEGLSTLFFSKTVKFRWLELSDATPHQREYPDEVVVFPGVVLLSGRPVNSKVPPATQKLRYPELKELQLSLSNVLLDTGFMATVLQKYKSRTDQEGAQGVPIPTACVISFNGRKLCTLQLAPGATTDADSAKVNGLVFSGYQSLAFLYPCNRTLFQSELRLEVQFRMGGATGAAVNPPILSAFTLTGSSLVKTFGQPGIVNREFHIPPSAAFLASLLAVKGDESSKSFAASGSEKSFMFRSSMKAIPEASHLPKIGERSAASAAAMVVAPASAAGDGDAESTAAPVCDVTIRSGPRGSLEIYEYDGKELFLDLIATFNLQKLFPPYAKHDTTRPNPYAVIYWNEKQVGRTRVYPQQSLVLWQQERFVLKLAIVGEDLHKLFKEEIAVMRWFELSLPAMGETQRLISNPSDIAPFVKLRGSYSTMPTNERVVEKTGPDFLLQVTELKDLSNTDAYGGANAVVEVLYNELVVGFSNVARESTSPKLSNEQFYIVRNQKIRRESLRLKVWSLIEPLPGQKHARKQFLGMVDLTREYLDELFAKAGAGTQWFPLSSDPELTTQENTLVKGKVAVEMRRFDASRLLHGPLMAVECVLWIHSISNLPSVDTFDLHPSSLVVVKRRYDKEGNQFEEIYRSNQLTPSQHPRFDREFCVVKAPIARDWAGFTVVVEVYNKREELVALRHFEGDELKELLLRDNPKAVVELMDFDLSPATPGGGEGSSSSSGGKALTAGGEDAAAVTKASAHAAKKRPRIRLGGGSRGAFDTVKHTIKRPVTRNSMSGPSTESTKNGRESGTNASSKSNKTLQSMRSMRSSRFSLRNTSAKKVFLKILNVTGHKPQARAVAKLACEVKVNGGTSCGRRVIEWRTGTGECAISGEGVYALDVGSLENAVNGGVELVFSSCLDNGDPLEVRGRVAINADALVQLKERDWTIEVPIQLYLDGQKKATRKRGTDVLRFVLTLAEAGRFMAFASKFPRNTEIYLRVGWGVGNVEVGKTQFYPFAAGAPIALDAEHFALASSMGDSLDDLSLTLSLHMKRDQRVIAQRVLDKRDDWLTLLEAGEIGHQLNLSADSDFLSGPPYLSVRLYQLPKFDKFSLFNLKLPCADDCLELECTLLGAEGLYKAKTIGSTDVIGIAYVGRHRALEIGRTTLFRDSQQPWWKENQTFRFRFPLNFAASADVLSSVGIFSPKDWQFTLVLGHMQRSGKPLYLGEVLLTGEDVARWFLSKATQKQQPAAHMKKVKLPLKAGSFVRKAEHKHVQGSAVLVLNKVHRNDITGRDLEFHVLGARNAFTDDYPPSLFDSSGGVSASTPASAGGAASLFAGHKGPDTYVRLRWNGLIVGATYVEKSSLRPVWDHEKFLGRLSGQITAEQASLTVELWQVHKTRQDTLIGGKELTGAELKALIDSQQSTWVALDALEDVPQAIQTKAIAQTATTGAGAGAVKPEVQIRVLASQNEAVDASLFDRYEIAVSRANGLAKIDGSEYNTSPYVICKWNDRELGRTHVIAKNASPMWAVAASAATAGAVDRFYVLVDKGLADIHTHSLRLEVWNHRKLRKGEFLGGVAVDGEDLRHIFESRLNEPVRQRLRDVLPEEARVRRFVQGDLVFTIRRVNMDGTSLSDNVFDQELQLEMLAKYDGSAGSALLEVALEQVYVRPSLSTTISTVHPGASVVSFVSASTTVAPSTFQPACKVSWHDHTLDVLSATSSTRDPAGATIANMQQKPPRVFTLNVPTDVVQQQLSVGAASAAAGEVHLVIEVWNELVDIKGNEIGFLSIPLSSLLRLYCGRFTFTLQVFDPHQSILPWHASVTFRLQLLFAQWHTLTTVVPTIFKRRISILGGSNLPYVNGLPPNTRCHLMLDGVSVVKSSVVAGNRDPKYHRVSEEIEVDIARKRELVVEVIYVDPRSRKEIVLGREEIPFESIIRPPRERFEVFLGPSGQVYAQYSFALSGSVKVEITGSNRFDASYAPWAAAAAAEAQAHALEDQHRPEDASLAPDSLVTRSTSNDGGDSVAGGHLVAHSHRAASSLSLASAESAATGPLDDFAAEKGEPLTNYLVYEEHRRAILNAAAASSATGGKERPPGGALAERVPAGSLKSLDRKWLGTLTAYSAPQEVTCRPEWLVLPIADLGVQVGTKKANFFGIAPGTVMAFGIERDKQRLAVSDAAMLEDVSFEISACWVKLRWKDVYRKLREIALGLFRTTVEDLLMQLQQDGAHPANEKEYVRNEVYDALEMAVHHCLPGCEVTFVRPTADYCMVLHEARTASAAAPGAAGRSRRLVMHHSHLTKRNDHVAGSKPLVTRQLLPSEYGQEMQMLGRNFQRSSVIASVQDFKQLGANADKPLQPLALTSSSFMEQSFPRFSISMFAEDVSLALMQVSGFELYRGGSYNSFTNVLSRKDIVELQRWFEALGELAGDVIYRAIEKDSITKVQAYLRHWNSSLSGLQTVLLEEASQVLQGFRLMEIVTVDPEHYRVSSLQEKTPQASQVAGRRITIHSIRVFARRADAATNDDDTASVGSQSTMSSVELFGARHAQQVAERAAALIQDTVPWQGIKRLFGGRGSIRSSFKTGGVLSEAESSKGIFALGRAAGGHDGGHDGGGAAQTAAEAALAAEASDFDEESTLQRGLGLEQVIPHLVLALQYDGVEHCLPLVYDPVADAFQLPKQVQDSMALYLKSDRRVQVRVYEVDDELHPVNEHVGAAAGGGRLGYTAPARSVQPFQQATTRTPFDAQEENEDGSSRLVLQAVTPRNPVAYDLLYAIDMHDGGADAAHEGDGDDDGDGAAAGGRGHKAAHKATGPAGRQDSTLHMLETMGVEGIDLEIVQATNLKKMAKEALPSAYCEVYRGKKLLGSTATVKASLSPVWNHRVHISLSDLKPPKASAGKKAATKKGGGRHDAADDDRIVVEVYDVTFLRRGNFLGQVELPIDAFLTSDDGAAADKDLASLPQEEHALQMKADVNPKKQAYVGGLLYVRHALRRSQKDATDAHKEDAAAKLQEKLRAQVAVEALPWKPALSALKRMKNPVLRLTVESADHLPVANRFTGTTDPYVSIFLGHGSPEVIAKTRVVSDDRSPVWSETFVLPVLATNEGHDVALEHFPSFRFEVYGHSKIASPFFLGAAELAPVVYASQQERYLELTGKQPAAAGDAAEAAATAATEAIAATEKSSKGSRKAAAASRGSTKTPSAAALPTEKVGGFFAQGALHVTWTLEDTASGAADGDDGSGGGGDGPPEAFRFVSQYGRVEVIVARATEVTLHRRVFGQWNPFVRLKYRGAVVGQTRIKSGTINPEYQERFVAYVDPQDLEEGLADLQLEVWHKDTNYLLPQDECLGVARIAPVEYLHPSDAVQRYPLVYPDGYKSKGAADMDGEYHPGTLLVKLAYQVVRQSMPLCPLTHRRLHYPYQELILAQEARREASVVPMIMMYDPDEEKRRQEREKAAFPAILRKTSAQAERYENNPFVRTGLISEAHYGQLTAAYRRGDRTTLRTRRMDMVCIPLFQRPANPFHGMKPLVAEVERLVREKEAARLGGSLAGAAASATGVMVLPHYLACRYPSGHVPRRDLKYLDTLQRALLPGLAEHHRRTQRREQLAKLIENIRLMQTLQLSPSDLLMQAIMDFEVATGAKVRLYVLDENGHDFLPISSADGKVIAWAAAAAASHHATAEQPSPHAAPSVASQKSARPSFMSTATIGSAPPHHKHRHGHIQLLARACRHDLVLQYFRGVLHVGKLQWLQQTLAAAAAAADGAEATTAAADDASVSGGGGEAGERVSDLLHQLCLPPFDAATPEMKGSSAASLLDDLEADDGFAEQLQEVFPGHFSSGALVLPVVGLQEHMIGLLVVKDLDRAYPPAAYEYVEDAATDPAAEVATAPDAGGSSAESLDGRDTDSLAAGGAGAAAVRAVKRLEALEHGILADLIRANDMLAVAMVQSRLLNMYRALKSFPVKADGVTPLSIVRYTFRMLCLAFPSVREVALWVVRWQEGLGVSARALLTHGDSTSDLRPPLSRTNSATAQQTPRQQAAGPRPLSRQASATQLQQHYHAVSAHHHHARLGTGSRGNSNSRLSVHSTSSGAESPAAAAKATTTTDAKPPAATASLGFFGRFFGLPMFAKPATASAATAATAAPAAHRQPSTATLDSAASSASLLRPKPLVASEAAIICGVFGSEDPRYLLRTALERKLFAPGGGGAGGGAGASSASGGASAATSAASTPLPMPRGSHRRTHQQLEAMQRDLRVLKQAEWTVTVPAVFQHPSHAQHYEQAHANDASEKRAPPPLEELWATSDSRSRSTDDYGGGQAPGATPGLTPTAALQTAPSFATSAADTPTSRAAASLASPLRGFSGFFAKSTSSAFQPPASAAAAAASAGAPQSPQQPPRLLQPGGPHAPHGHHHGHHHHSGGGGGGGGGASRPHRHHRRQHSSASSFSAHGAVVHKRGGPLDNGTFPGVVGLYHQSALRLVHDEIVRCVGALKQQSFVVSTGHALTALCAANRLQLQAAPELDLAQHSYDRWAGARLSAEAVAASRTSTRLSSKKAGIAAAALASISAETELAVLRLLKEHALLPALQKQLPSARRGSSAATTAAAAAAAATASTRGRSQRPSAASPDAPSSKVSAANVTEAPGAVAAAAAIAAAVATTPASAKAPASGSLAPQTSALLQPRGPGAGGGTTRRLPPVPPTVQPPPPSGDSPAAGAAALSTKAGASRRSAILQPRPPPTQPPGDADADEEPQPLLFVAVNTHGLHGATGWGTMSPALLPILETVAAMMEANLWKWHQANEQRLEKQAAQERQLLAERQVRDGEAAGDADAGDEDIDESEADLVAKSLKKRLSIIDGADEDSASSASSSASSSGSASDAEAA